MLILALSYEGRFALATLWDYLLLRYDGDYTAANWHLPVLSQLIQAEWWCLSGWWIKFPNTLTCRTRKFSAISRNPCWGMCYVCSEVLLAKAQWRWNTPEYLPGKEVVAVARWEVMFQQFGNHCWELWCLAKETLLWNKTLRQTDSFSPHCFPLVESIKVCCEE